MGRLFAVLYGVIAYLGFFVVVVYLMGFLGGYSFEFILGEYAITKTINSGPESPLGVTLMMNVGLLALFGIQHTVMARPGFKSWWTS